MRFRLSLFVLATVALAVAKAPASLVEIGLAAASGNALCMSSSQGSLWHGHSTLVTCDANSRSALLWLPLAWQFEPAGLLSGELRWQGDVGSDLRGEWSFGIGGFRLQNVAVQAPAAVVPPLFPSALAHAGWSGDLAMLVPDWRCDWRGNCAGGFAVQWKGASSTMLPGQGVLGDFEIQFNGDGRRLSFEVRTLAGKVELSGNGSLTDQGAPSFEGWIGSSPDILKLLPGIGFRLVQSNSLPGRFLVHYPVSR